MMSARSRTPDLVSHSDRFCRRHRCRHNPSTRPAHDSRPRPAPPDRSPRRERRPRPSSAEVRPQDLAPPSASPSLLRTSCFVLASNLFSAFSKQRQRRGAGLGNNPSHRAPLRAGRACDSPRIPGSRPKSRLPATPPSRAPRRGSRDLGKRAFEHGSLHDLTAQTDGRGVGEEGILDRSQRTVRAERRHLDGRPAFLHLNG